MVVLEAKNYALMRYYLKRCRQILLKFPSLFEELDVRSIESKIDAHFLEIDA